MAVKTYIGDSGGIAREIKKLYIGDANGIARELKKLYAGDSNGIARKIFEKSDFSFSQSTLPTTSGALRVAYGNDKFVAVYASGAYYSTDGINWTAVNDSNARGSCITFGNGMFVAPAASAYVYTSADGVNWSRADAYKPANSPSYCNIAYGDGRFVVVGSSVYGSYMWSSDGISWSGMSVGTNNTFRDVAYGNGLFAATAHVIYSTTSRDLSIRYTGTQPLGLYKNIAQNQTLWWSAASLAFGNDKFVATCQNSANIYTSTDGKTWSHSASFTSSGNWLVRFCNDKFIAVKYNSNVLAYSSDGNSWAYLTLPTSANWTDICYGNGTYVIVAKGSNIALYSR